MIKSHGIKRKDQDRLKSGRLLTLISCVTALTNMMGIAGWSSFSLDSAIHPLLMSHRAPCTISSAHTTSCSAHTTSCSAHTTSCSAHITSCCTHTCHIVLTLLHLAVTTGYAMITHQNNGPTTYCNGHTV